MACHCQVTDYIEIHLEMIFYYKNALDTWFGLVSLFNGISTFVWLFNAKAILPEEQ